MSEDGKEKKEENRMKANYQACNAPFNKMGRACHTSLGPSNAGLGRSAGGGGKDGSGTET